MRYIDILPQIRHDMFLARIVMSDYETEEQMVIRITARRNDGMYVTKTVKYPELDVEYNGEVLVYFFGMSKSLIAQIVSVRLNGVEIRVNSTEVTGTDIVARYDDSLTRIPWAENMNNIKLDFEVVDTKNPKTLKVYDTSEWGILSERPAVIEIKTPDKEDVYAYYLGKNNLNIFTSLTLGYNCEDSDVTYKDLPDGVYDITIIGSPSSYKFNRKYLKTDYIRLSLDKAWVKAGILCDHQDDDMLSKIQEIEYVLVAAESSMRLGFINDAKELLKKAYRLLDILNKCEGCPCQ